MLAIPEADASIDLVLLNLHMRGDHSLADLAAIRAQYPAVVVVLVSAHENPQVVRRALDHGVASEIPKRTVLVDLGEAIRTVLDCAQ